MAYSVQLCTSDAVASFMMRAPSVDMGFPSTITYPWEAPFNYLVYSQWMCGPYDAVHGATGIGCLGGVFSFGIGGVTLTDNSSGPGSGQFFSGTFDAGPAHGVFSHMIMSVDTANQVVQVYINDTAAPVTGTWVGSLGTNHLNVGYVPACAWGWNPNGTLVPGGSPGIGDIWCAAPAHFIDLSVTANRRAFINADLSPVDLGTTGVALGITPQMYFTVRPGGVPLDIVTNRGTGQSLSQVDPGLRFQAPGSCVMPVPPGTHFHTLTDAELYFTPGTGFVDLADINARRKFVSAAGCAQWLGAEGELPFGQPSVYLSAEPGDAAAFADNRGAAEDFAINGTIGLAGSAPCCTSYVTTEAADHNAKPEWRLSVSDDGGRTWSLLVKPRGIGETGEYLTRLRWMKLGLARERMIRLESSDSVRRNIVGFYFDITQGMG